MPNYYPKKPLNLEERVTAAGGLENYLKMQGIDYALFVRTIEAKTSMETMRRILKRQDGIMPHVDTLRGWRKIYRKQTEKTAQ